MKKNILTLFSAIAFLTIFNACSTKVDLYADYKDITVVYGLLDCNADTNFIKINKAFLGPGNALTIAQVFDSCNYPGKLNAKLVEHRASANGSTYQITAEYPLDTITVHDKEPGIFYAPDQRVYYTTQKIRSNNDQYKYRYELQVEHGDSIISAITDIVGGRSFLLPQSALNFTSTNNNGVVNWTPCPYASIYEVVFKFHYFEVRSTTDTVERIVTMPMGSHPEVTLHEENGTYSISYKGSMFFNKLKSFMGNDTLDNSIRRLIAEPSMEVAIAAGGDELYNFITVNGPSSSIVQTLPEYTNVKGGYGVLSSRVMLTKRMRLSGNTIPELKSHENWHFEQIK